jgi:trehalose/maltose transport system substrate-binding protein
LDAGEAVRRDALAEFTRTTGIEVDLIPTWGTSAEQLTQTLRLLKQGATTPDVYLIDVIWPGTLGTYFLDLKSYSGQDSAGHLPVLLTNDTVQDRLVSMPFYLNVGMLFYRTDLLAKYGYSHPPATWEELERMAARIQQGERASGNRDFWGYVWQGEAYEGLTCNALEWQVSWGGGRVIEPDGTVSVNNGRTAEVLERVARWIGTISPPSVLSYTEGDSLTAFRTGNAAFLRHWSSALQQIHDGQIAGRYAASLLPAGPRGRAQALGGFHLSVSRFSQHPQEAVQLVTYLTGGAVQLKRALVRGTLPTIPQLYSEPALLKALPYASMLGAVGTGAWVARPSTISGSHYAEVSRAYYQTVHAILRHETAAPEALRKLEERLTTLTGFRAGAPRDAL